MPRTKSGGGLVELKFPFKGVHEGFSYANQPPDTCYDAQNVRAWDPTTGRLRGGQRPGTARYPNAQLNGADAIQDINHNVVAKAISGTSIGNRTFYRVAVAGGHAKRFTSSAFTAMDTAGPHFVTSGVIFSAQYLAGDIYYADGTNYKFFDASAGTPANEGDIASWTASSGTLPANGANKPRLIETWRGRIILSGIIGDDQNWFMSAVGDATDWNYSATPPKADDAVAGNSPILAKPADKINCIIPYNDANLMFGCDHSIYCMRGDPRMGGQLTLISSVTGTSFGRPWCMDDMGIVYFFGSRGGLFRMTGPCVEPERLSAGIVDESLATVNLDTSIVRLMWNDRQQGVHVFITPLTTGAVTHWFYERRTSAFWKDKFATNAHNPNCCHVIDGDDPADRTYLIGCQDGRIREFKLTAKDDDDAAIDSYVFIGPIQAPAGAQRLLLNELQAVLGASSNDVTYDVYRGDSADDARQSASFWNGTWSSGRNLSDRRRATGEAIYIRLRNNTITQSWQLETLRAQIVGLGYARQRSQTV